MKFQHEWIQTTLDAIDVDGTRTRYEQALNFFWAWYIKANQPELSVHVLNRYKRFLQKQGYASSTIGVGISSIKRALMVNMRPVTISDRLDLQDMQALKVRQVKSANYSVSITAEERDKIIATFNFLTPKGIRNIAMFALLFYAGLRRGEISNLNVDDYDPIKGMLFIREAKGNKNKAIPLHPFVIEKLDAWLRVRQSESEAMFIKMINVAGKGERLKAGYIYILMITACQKAGLPHYHPHDGRTTFVTMLHDNGVPIGDIQKLVGHANPATTMGYVRTDYNKLRNSVLKLK